MGNDNKAITNMYWANCYNRNLSDAGIYRISQLSGCGPALSLDDNVVRSPTRGLYWSLGKKGRYGKSVDVNVNGTFQLAALINRSAHSGRWNTSSLLKLRKQVFIAPSPVSQRGITTIKLTRCEGKYFQKVDGVGGDTIVARGSTWPERQWSHLDSDINWHQCRCAMAVRKRANC